MQLRLILLAIVAAGVVGAPLVSESQPYLQSMKHNITFDKLSGAKNVSYMAPIGLFADLDYEGIGALEVGYPLAGVDAESSLIVAAYSPDASLLQTSTPSITVGYPGSLNYRLDFTSFYFGCELPTSEPSASVPVSCSVTVLGYLAQYLGAEQKFSFDGGKTLKANMVKATLSKEFEGLDEVKFRTHSPVSKDVATLLDNFVYTTYARAEAALEQPERLAWLTDDKRLANS